MSSYQYRKPHCGDKTILRPSYLHNGISYTGKMTSLYRGQTLNGLVNRGQNWTLDHAARTHVIQHTYVIKNKALSLGPDDRCTALLYTLNCYTILHDTTHSPLTDIKDARLLVTWSRFNLQVWLVSYFSNDTTWSIWLCLIPWTPFAYMYKP